MTKKQSKKPAAAETSLVLRVCRPDLTSHSGFSWPADVGAEVSAPDWKKNKIQVGARGTATAGYRGTATAGYRGTATAGESGTATAGESGTATAGESGTATAGESGTATAGNYGEIRIQWWDSKAQRYRTKIGYVGEDGIKPDTAYRLNDNHELEKVQP